jgi:adenine phosphoribosyltransferase
MVSAPNGGDEVAAVIASRLRPVPDFPQPSVLFQDITPLLADGPALHRVMSELAAVARRSGPVDLVAGVEARGFIVAAALACELGVGVVPVRKAGKLPPPTVRRSYTLEYGTAEIEVPMGTLDGRRVYLVDDVLATGGTLRASADLLTEAGAELVGIGVIVELGFLEGRAKLDGLPALRSLLTL